MNYQLYRRPDHAIIGGVCAGVADRQSWDPTAVRLAFVAALLLFNGLFLFLYIAAWFLLPTKRYVDKYKQ